MSNEHSEAFSSVPILDYDLLTRDGGIRKPQFLSELRNALVNVGFFYLANPPVDKVPSQSWATSPSAALT